jgi:TP901 family phage tail tape measure protein
MKAQLKLAQTDKAVTTFGQKLTLNSTKLITAGGLMAGAVTAVGVATVKMAADFEKSMRNVNSIAKLSEKEFANMSGEVINLSKTLPQSAKTLADGLYDISSSGFAGADGLVVLDAAAKAASAGLTTTATSAKGITAVLNAFGYEADKADAVADTMFKTVDKGVITFEELSATVGDWVGMAKAANLSFEEASGAIAYMTTKGIGAAEAGTSLTRMLTGIIKPSEEMAAVIKNAGFESGEMMLKTLGLTGTMKVLNDATGGSITKLIELMPEIRGVRGANALLGAGYEELTGYMNEFKDTTGATDTALEEQSKSLDFQLQILRNNISAIGITLGTDLIPGVTETVTKLTEWISANDKLVVNLIKVGGGAATAVSGILLLAGALGKLRAIAITHPIGLIVAAIAGLNIAVGSMSDRLQENNNRLDDFGAAFLSGFAPLPEAIDSFKNLSFAMQEYKEGNIGFIEALFMSRREIEELRQAQEESIPTLDEIKIGIDEYKQSLINQGYTEEKAIELTNNHVKTMGYTIDKSGELIKVTEQSTEAAEENTDAIDSQAEAAEDLESAISNLVGSLEDGSVSPKEFMTQLSNLGIALKDVEDGFNAIIEAAFKFYNTQYALKESAKDYEEELKKYRDMLTPKTVTSGGTEKDLLANIKDQENLTKALEKNNEVANDANATEAERLEASIALTDAQKEAEEIAKNSTATTKTYTASQEELDEQLKKVTDSYMELLNWGMMVYNQNEDALAQGNLTADQADAAIEQNKLLQEQFIQSGLEAVGFKTTSLESFTAMAEGFGLSAEDILKIADDMGIGIDDATRKRLIEISADDEAAQIKIDELAGTLFTLVDGEYVAVINADNKSAEEIITQTSDQLYKIVNGEYAPIVGADVEEAQQKIYETSNQLFMLQNGEYIPVIGMDNIFAKEIIKETGDKLFKLVDGEYVPVIEADNSDALEGIKETWKKLNELDGETATVNIKYKVTGSVGSSFSENALEAKAMGGIVGYDTGGIVGIPRAASGMVIPQTGQEHLIIAHDYETILNTSQQKNIAEWIMGRANSRPESNVNVPIEIRIPIELDGRIIAETSASFIYDGTQTKLRLGG